MAANSQQANPQVDLEEEILFILIENYAKFSIPTLMLSVLHVSHSSGYCADCTDLFFNFYIIIFSHPCIILMSDLEGCENQIRLCTFFYF